MINIDKTDSLYRYLSGLGVENIDEVYTELANNGRYRRDDVRKYLQSTFQSSMKEDVLDSDLERLIDYYHDIRQIKPLKVAEINDLLKKYKEQPTKAIQDKILNSKLKDILWLCINYKTLHKDADIQDLIQISSLGLMQALDRYDTSAKISFDDYVLYYVRDHIMKENKEKIDG